MRRAEGVNHQATTNPEELRQILKNLPAVTNPTRSFEGASHRSALDESRAATLLTRLSHLSRRFCRPVSELMCRCRGGCFGLLRPVENARFHAFTLTTALPNIKRLAVNRAKSKVSS